MQSFRKIVGQLKSQKQMSDFERFLQFVQKGNLEEVINSFNTDFLELMTNDKKKMRPIHFACEKGHLEVVKFLLENKCSLECEDEDKKQPIHYASLRGHLEIVKFLCQNKCSIECEDVNKKLPIHYACLNGHLEIAKFFFQNQGGIECEDLWERQPIHYGCENGHLEIVKFLMEKKCSIECEDQWKKRPIHYACENGHLEIVKFLFQNECSIECKDHEMHRPIHYVCWKGHLEIVKFLFEKNCNIECEDESKKRPIHLACEKGHLEVVKFLLQNKCRMECETQWKKRPIHYACENGHLEIVKLLFRCNCDLDCTNYETPMESARKWEHKSCDKFLNENLKLRSKIFDCVRRNNPQALVVLYSSAILTMHETGLSILEVALQSHANEIIDYFLNKLVTTEELPFIENYMKYCSRPDAVQLVEECLLYRSIRFHDAGGFHLSCSAKTINEHGKLVMSSFLEVAAEFGCKPFIHSILKKSIYNEEEWTKAKDLAILNGHDEIAEAILRRINLLRNRADKNFTLLHSAVCDNDPDMVKYILDRNLVNPDFNNEVVGTALALAHMMCYEECIEVLEKFNVDVNTQNKYSQSPLHEAIVSGMTDHCSYLISRVKNIDEPGFMGFTALQCAVVKGYEKLCDELVKNGASCVRYVEVLQKLEINKAAVLPISKFENAFTLCMKINKTIYPSFLEVWDVDKMKCADGDGNSLLHIAVKTLQPELCNTLIKSGASVEAINDQGNSPLFALLCNPEYGQINNVIEILNILIDSGTDVNKISNSGISVFQVSSQWNSEILMLSLLSKQPKVTCLTANDFKLAFTKQWTKYATILISVMTEGCLQSFITHEIFQLAMTQSDPKLLMSLFVKSSREVQQSVIEDLLDNFAFRDRYDDFVSLLHIGIVKPKLLHNGETLLTNLLKKRDLKYCLALINCTTNKRCLGLANATNQIPLQIAIELELFDLINSLILYVDHKSDQEFNWDTPLILLCQKLSISSNDDVDQKLLVAINTIICRGGDVFKEIIKGSAIISYCPRFRKEIETFQNNERNKVRGGKKTCSICLDMEVNCVLDCGHTFCMDCGTQLYRCAICNSTTTNPKNLYFS